MKRPRFSIKSLIVAIAIVALTLWAWIMIDRGSRLLVHARQLAFLGVRARKLASDFRSYNPPADYCPCCTGIYFGLNLDPEARAKAQVAVHSQTIHEFDIVAAEAGAMSQLYFDAAYRPWQSEPKLPDIEKVRAKAFELLERFRSNADSY